MDSPAKLCLPSCSDAFFGVSFQTIFCAILGRYGGQARRLSGEPLSRSTL